MAGAMALGELTHHMETRVENAMSVKTLPTALFGELETSWDRMGILFEQLQKPRAPEGNLPRRGGALGVAAADIEAPKAVPEPAPWPGHQRPRRSRYRLPSASYSRRRCAGACGRRRPAGQPGGRSRHRAQPDRRRNARAQGGHAGTHRQRPTVARAVARDRNTGGVADAIAPGTRQGIHPRIRPPASNFEPLHPIPGSDAADGRERQRRIDRPRKPRQRGGPKPRRRCSRRRGSTATCSRT